MPHVLQANKKKNKEKTKLVKTLPCMGPNLCAVTSHGVQRADKKRER